MFFHAFNFENIFFVITKKTKELTKKMESLQCVCCHKTPEDYAQNLRLSDAERSILHARADRKVCRIQSPIRHCYACGRVRRHYGSMEEMEALRERKYRSPSRGREWRAINLRSSTQRSLPVRFWKKVQKVLLNASAHAPRTSTRVKRNEPCPCGSGTKYKKCCLVKR